MEKKKNNEKLNEMLGEIVENLGTVADTNSMIGKPISTLDGKIIIPISKITIGFLSGGGEYGEVKFLKHGEDLPFAGGNGGIVTLKPSGFLVSEKERFQFVPITSDATDRLLATMNDLVKNLTGENHDSAGV